MVCLKIAQALHLICTLKILRVQKAHADLAFFMRMRLVALAG